MITTVLLLGVLGVLYIAVLVAFLSSPARPSRARRSKELARELKTEAKTEEWYYNRARKELKAHTERVERDLRQVASEIRRADPSHSESSSQELADDWYRWQLNRFGRRREW